MHVPLIAADQSLSRRDFSIAVVLPVFHILLLLNFLILLLLIMCVMPYWQAKEMAMNKKSDQQML